MNSSHDLSRFLSAHESTFKTALSEIQAGKKETHWSWFIFPQIVGLGSSETSVFYALKSIDEARAFWNSPTLHDNYIRILSALLQVKDRAASEILGSPDDLKLHSSITLFLTIAPHDETLNQVLTRFFNGELDTRTVEILERLR